MADAAGREPWTTWALFCWGDRDTHLAETVYGPLLRILRSRHSCIHAHQMNIEIQRATKTLDQGDCAGSCHLSGKARFFDLMCR
ncbi:MAG: hypothetical protein ACI9SC_000293 [Gammaproteobacteria bacterium]|jgi:hypothetical protein